MTPTGKTFEPGSFLFQLPVAAPAIPDRVRAEAEKERMAVKPEFHMSVIVTTNEHKVRSALKPEARDDMIALANRFEWEYELRDEYYVTEHHYGKREIAERDYEAMPEHTRRSIIQLADLPDLAPFYEKLEQLAGVTLPLPVPHVTLFAWSDYPPLMTRGIGICSEADFEAFKVRKV